MSLLPNSIYVFTWGDLEKFHHVGPEDPTKVVRLGWQCLYLMSHLLVLAFILSTPHNGVNSNVNFRNGRLHLNHKVPIVNTHGPHDYGCHTEDVPVPM